MNWMIYGANGYTGELIAREAAKRGLKPILAGRRRETIEALAKELGLESRVFGLDNPTQVGKHLQGCELVLHCAGPFSATSAPMVEGCLQAGAHYLDITGEIGVFEHVHAQHDRAREAGVVLCPGVGFDVIPTDCVAAALKAEMPDATHLELGFDTRTGLSPGTAKTTVEGMAQGGKVRRDGKIITVSMGYEIRRIDFGDGEKLAMTIPWGDVSTAYHNTGIPNITTFVPGPALMVRLSKLANLLRPILSWGWMQRFLKARIDKHVSGPDETSRAKLPTYVWGEVRNARGEKKTARVRTENSYSLTITGALAVIDYLMKRKPEGGAYTPAKLIGPELVTQLPGSSDIVIS
ncbi:MAG: saccharopine dehydrogenase NADP-binding domain-containing protein [Pseudomonadales bacterium]|nr:saccharopine dehydrogenase NADP-binding domain-containing protein [Pseudomonadales bacterium]